MLISARNAHLPHDSAESYQSVEEEDLQEQGKGTIQLTEYWHAGCQLPEP
jgi:hypothetical protein